MNKQATPKITVTKQIHDGWKENSKLIEIGLKPLFHKWQYTYESSKGKVSLIQFYPRMYGKYCWEIYGYEKIFSDVKRFKTKKEAVARIKAVLL